MSQGGHLVKPGGSRRTWAIMYRDTEGKLHWEGKFRTKSNAQARLSEVLNEIDRGTYTRPSSLSFEEFAKEWLSGRRQIRGSTEAGYSSLIDKQLVPRLGAMTVARIRFEHIDAAVSGMLEDHARKVRVLNQNVPITALEFKVLEFLILHKGIVHDRETIIKALWTNNINIDRHNIDVIVRRIRMKIEPDHTSPRYILTTKGLGYSFTDKLS